MEADFSTLDGAVRILLEERAEAKRLEARQEAAKETLKRHFRANPGVTEYVCAHGRATYEMTTQRRLDHVRVRAELGVRAERLEYDAPVETVRVNAVLSPEVRASLDAETLRRTAE